MTQTRETANTTANRTLMARLLDRIERVGNRMPSPAMLFLLLCAFIIVLSQVLFWFNVHATYEAVTPPPVPTSETYYGGSVEPTDVGPSQPEPAEAYKPHIERTKVRGLLTGEGIRYLFTSFVSNFRDFAALAIILVVMLGVGLAETAGLIGALMRMCSPPPKRQLVAVGMSRLLLVGCHPSSDHDYRRNRSARESLLHERACQRSRQGARLLHERPWPGEARREPDARRAAISNRRRQGG